MLILPNGRSCDPQYRVETWWEGPIEVKWSLNFPGGDLYPGVVAAARKYIKYYIPPSPVPDPGCVKAIREFYPNYVPLWCTRIFKDPSGTLVPWGYHVIGRWRESPDDAVPDKHRIVNVDRPHDFPFEGGVIYEQRVVSRPWPDTTYEKGLNTPDIPLPGPTNEEFVTWMRQMYHEAREQMDSLKQIFDMRDRQIADKEQATFDKSEADADYKFKQFRNLYNKAIDEGRIFDEPREYNPKPFLFQGA